MRTILHDNIRRRLPYCTFHFTFEKETRWRILLMMCHINNMYELRTLCTQKDKTKESPKALKKKIIQERSWSTHVREVERDVRLRPLEVLVAHNFSKIKPYLYSPQAQIAFGLISDYVGPLSTFGHPFSSLPCSWEHHTHQ